MVSVVALVERRVRSSGCAHLDLDVAYVRLADAILGIAPSLRLRRDDLGRDYGFDAIA
jgi:hypothetical protein